MDVATQTERSFLRDRYKKKKQIDNSRVEAEQPKQLPEPIDVIDKKRILCCDFEIFGIVQGLFQNSYLFIKNVNH